MFYWEGGGEEEEGMRGRWRVMRKGRRGRGGGKSGVFVDVSHVGLSIFINILLLNINTSSLGCWAEGLEQQLLVITCATNIDYLVLFL